MEKREREVRELVAKVLKISVAEMPQDASAETIGEWDSMAQLNICMLFQERFKIEMGLDRIENCTSVAALAALLPP